MKLDDQDSATFKIVTHEFEEFIKACEAKLDLSTRERRTIFEQNVGSHQRQSLGHIKLLSFDRHVSARVGFVDAILPSP